MAWSLAESSFCTTSQSAIWDKMSTHRSHLSSSFSMVSAVKVEKDLLNRESEVVILPKDLVILPL